MNCGNGPIRLKGMKSRRIVLTCSKRIVDNRIYPREKLIGIRRVGFSPGRSDFGWLTIPGYLPEFRRDLNPFLILVIKTPEPNPKTSGSRAGKATYANKSRRDSGR